MASTIIHTYDPKQVAITLGDHIVSGYAEDSYITIEPSGDGITKKVGCDGEIVRSLSPDNTFNVKLNVLYQSASNAWLQERYDLDMSTGEGMFPILIKDLKGTMIFSADACWAIKPAARGFGKESGDREWELTTGTATLTEGLKT